MFTGRESELEKLNKMYTGNQFECAIIYGRRRVGKTSLIQEFIKDKKAIYFLSLETSEQINLENFSKSILCMTMKDVRNMTSFINFPAALEAAGDLAADNRIILVIDEYPYLAHSVQGISSMLQAQIDMHFKNTKLFLILCGSSMTFMENQVLGYQSPLYGRRTAQIRLQPFSFFESVHFHRDYNDYDKAVLYGITGGIPLYLSQMDGKKSLKENIIDHFFDPTSYLFEEPQNLLKQELREPQTYNNIITAIATGSSKLNEISTKTRLETSLCSKYLSTLITLGIIKKEQSVLTSSTRRTIYRLADNMFRFWYRFVPSHASLIQSGAGEKIYEKIESQISAYMGEVFEEISLQYLWRENKFENLPFYFHEAGRWWGTDPVKKQEQEIDIIAFDDSRAIFCECKWKNETVGQDVLDDLIEKSKRFYFEEKYYFLFSKSGFSKEVKKKVSENIKLIEFKKNIMF